MSNIMYDFLTESFMFKEDAIDKDFKDYSDDAIRKELENYRSYILKNIKEIFEEINDGYENTSLFSEMFSSQRIGLELLKQCSLYVHKFIIDDPLFRYTTNSEKNMIQDSMNKYLGMDNKKGVDRSDLVKTVQYLKLLTPAIVTGYVKIIPGSLMHEPPKNIPLMYSPKYFSDVRQKEILDYFHNNAIVSPVEKTESGFVIRTNSELKPCRGINIDFKNHVEFYGKLYLLFESKVHSMNDATREVTFIQTLPDEPPSKEQFDAWVYQSINQTANGFCLQLENEVALASKLNALYFTKSDFVDNLLRINFEPSKKVSDKVTQNTLETLLKISLPIIEEASLADILNVRFQDGEIFENFRGDIEKRFNELRTIKNEDDLIIKLENISHELTDLHVNSIERQTKLLRNKFFRNSAIVAASLAGAIATNGFSLFGAAIAAGQGFNSYQDYKNEVKKNPAYLLWQVKRNIRK